MTVEQRQLRLIVAGLMLGMLLSALDQTIVSGYILTPLMLSLIFSSIIGGRLISRLSYRTILVTGMAVMAVGFYLMSQMDVNTTNLTVVIYMIITGLAWGR